MNPGAIAKDRIPYAAPSTATACVMASIADLVAAYGPERAETIRAETELTLTMVPDPAERIVGRTARITAMGPKTFVWNIWSRPASVVSSTAERSPTPALLTSTSRPPASASTWPTPFLIDSGSFTSRERTSTSVPASAAAARRASPDASSRIDA